MKKRICYKVVYPTYACPLQSFVSLSTISCLSYAVNKLTIAPKDTKLFVFDTLENAKQFFEICMYGSSYIYKCEAYNVSKPKYMSEITSVSVPLFWKLRKQKKSTKHIQKDVPPGTLYADSVKLLEKVTR